MAAKRYITNEYVQYMIDSNQLIDLIHIFETSDTVIVEPGIASETYQDYIDNIYYE